MSAYTVLGLFCMLLLGGTLIHLPLVLCLVLGILLFWAYGHSHSCSTSLLVRSALSPLKQNASIVLLFLEVGILSALWREAGTLSNLVTLIQPLLLGPSFAAMSFLVCSLMSMMLGTAVGTAVTIGALCMHIGLEAGQDPILLGGALLAGCYVGDRTSPVSTSALLISNITQTELKHNVKGMLKTSIIPFAAALVLYMLLGTPLAMPAHQEQTTLWLPALIPAVLVIVASFIGLSIAQNLALSCLAAAALIIVQGNMGALIPTMESGACSMQTMMGIIIASSCLGGIMKASGLLDSSKRQLRRIEHRGGAFCAVLVASIITSVIACNQTLAIMLTRDLFGTEDTDAKDAPCMGTHGTPTDADSTEELALYLENSVVLIAAVVPWSISSMGVLTALGAPTASVIAASFCFMVPLVYLVQTQIKRSGYLERFKHYRMRAHLKA